ncbi:putative transcriptional regulator [Bosea sp. OAE506]|uniref:MucR family transcriptional regulator n=1 Tax=Bosea sp. OAE506 TaxID=2663870 RepID=UPI00178C1066
MVQPIDNLIKISAEVVAAYVGNNSVTPADVPDIINSVYAALKKLVSGPEMLPATTLVPAVPIRKSVTPEAIICLENGKRYKSLKRHLRTAYGLTPDQYRAKWNLPPDYPMVAPAHAKVRSDVAMSVWQERKSSKLTSKASGSLNRRPSQP